jgi:hypothetical protein
VADPGPQQEELAAAEGAIRAARPPGVMLAVAALIGGGGAFVWARTVPNAPSLLFAAGGAIAAPALVWVVVKAQARKSATDHFFTEFAVARGWFYLPAAPLRRDSPFLAGGTRQRAGRGFRLAVGGRDSVLYEHVRIDGSGKSQQSTAYVVLLVEATAPDAIGLRIRQRHGFRVAGGMPLRELELEYTELSERFVVEATPRDDLVGLRALLTPTFITAFLDLADANCYLGDYLEVGVGFVVLASLGTITLEDGDYLDATLPAAQPLLDELLGS